ncbi:MAG: acetyl-CoA carboxylase, biotin carboxyl carrier protein [Propionibacteriales bacterium]|nr:acetyl-CoA carboxylase, biotin carboxyl carrier protein [Propionibacteriales bacterium]
MTELTAGDLRELAAYFVESDLKVLHVKAGEVELFLSADATSSPPVASPPVAAAPDAAGPGPPSEASAASSASTPAEAAPASSAADPIAGTDEDLPITASSVGIFYRRPKAEKPPYVEVGSLVDVSTTVGLIEAMKVFTAVPAGVEGVITEVVVENETFVEFGQTLFRVRTAAEGR